MGDYKGNRKINMRREPGFVIRVQVKPADIYLLTRIFEGHSHLGFAAPINASEGIVGIYTTPETQMQVITILENLPIKCDIKTQN